MNLQAFGDRVARDVGRVVCKTVQSVAKKYTDDQSPKSPPVQPLVRSTECFALFSKSVKRP